MPGYRRAGPRQPDGGEAALRALRRPLRGSRGLAGRGRLGRRLLGLGVRRLGGALLGPWLVELDAPLALLVLHEGEPRAEIAARAALEAGDRLDRPAPGDQLARDRHRQLLARLALPDHEAAARIVATPAGVALAVLVDVAPAHRARAEIGARDADVLELGVELGDRLLGELLDVAHELLSRVRPLLDRGQAMLPVAGQRGRRQRVLAEQANHVQALLRAHQRAAVALDVADGDQALDDRRARGRRADARVLHRLAQLLVVDELAGGLHGGEERGVAVAPRRLGLL